MGTCNLYEKGFKAGYKIGYNSGLEGGKAKFILNNDLLFVYGIMSIVLKMEKGMQTEDIEDIIESIQKRWQTIDIDLKENEEDIETMVERITGVQIKQVCD